MKTIPIALAAQYDAAAATLCRCLNVKRRDGMELGITTLDRDLVVDGLNYRGGLDLSDMVSTSGLAVDNLELTILLDPVSDPDLLSDLRATRWNYAEFRVFQVNYLRPGDGQEEIKSGTTGEVSIRDGAYIVELRGLTQAFQQPVGNVTSKTCRANFCDFPVAQGNNLCRLDPADFTFTGTVTTVFDQATFADTARTEDDDYYTEGILTFTDGPNAQWAQKVKLFSSGQFTLFLPAPFEIQEGDGYSVIAGCQKRHIEDCKDRFSNILNFQGEPHLPGVDSITALPSDDPA